MKTRKLKRHVRRNVRKSRRTKNYKGGDDYEEKYKHDIDYAYEILFPADKCKTKKQLTSRFQAILQCLMGNTKNSGLFNKFKKGYDYKITNLDSSECGVNIKKLIIIPFLRDVFSKKSNVYSNEELVDLINQEDDIPYFFIVNGFSPYTAKHEKNFENMSKIEEYIDTLIDETNKDDISDIRHMLFVLLLKIINVIFYFAGYKHADCLSSKKHSFMERLKKLTRCFPDEEAIMPNSPFEDLNTSKKETYDLVSSEGDYTNPEEPTGGRKSKNNRKNKKNRKSQKNQRK